MKITRIDGVPLNSSPEAADQVEPLKPDAVDAIGPTSIDGIDHIQKTTPASADPVQFADIISALQVGDISPQVAVERIVAAVASQHGPIDPQIQQGMIDAIGALAAEDPYLQSMIAQLAANTTDS